MSATIPLITVTIPVYNNGKHLKEALQSVLNQTFTDFEIIIINNGSEDECETILKHFDDERIVYFYQENQGTSVATNQAIEHARGEYIALFAADHVWFPEKLEREYQYLLETGAKLVFSWVEFISDDGQTLDNPYQAQNFYNHPNRTRAEMLNWFFFKGNYLCTVSALIQREVLIDAELLRVTNAQLPDFDMWLKLIKQYNLPVLPKKLVKYRIYEDENNVRSFTNTNRSYFELIQLYRNIFDDLPSHLFREAFARHLRNSAFEDGPEYELEKAFIFLELNKPQIRLIGVEKLFHLLQDPRILELSKAKYGFGLPELFLLTKSVNMGYDTEMIKLRDWSTQIENEYKELKKWTEQLDKNCLKAYEDAGKVWQAKQALELKVAKLNERLELEVLAKQRLEQERSDKEKLLQNSQQVLERFERDLRELQSTKTVQLASAIGKFLTRLTGK